MKKYLLLLLHCTCFGAMAQVAQVLPLQPCLQDTIHVVYDPNLPQARLNGKENIFVRLTSYLQDGSIEKLNRPLLLQHKKLMTSFLLPPATASFKVDFYTLNKDDELASKNLLVYQKNGSKPVRGAYLESFFSNQVDSLFKLEIANYPDHYHAYARYMNVVSMIKDPELGKKEINALLKHLDSLASKSTITNKDLGLMAAFCVGHAKTNNLKLAKSYLFKLFEQYPLAAETAFAFSIYNYENYKANNQQIEDDVRAKLRAIYMNHPNAAVCTDANVFEYLRNDSSIPTSAFEKVILPLMAKDKIAYYALGNLPALYISRNEKLDTAKQLLLVAIKRFEDGTIQHQYRLNNGHFQMYVPNLLMQLGKIDGLQKDFQQAVVHVSAAMQLISGHSAEGNFLPDMLKQRANAYEAMGNLNLALGDYQKLYLDGEIEAIKEMERLYPLCATKTLSFVDFLTALKTRREKPLSTSKQLANNFEGTDLQGNKISLADLKGKIVVVNVWGIGCGPCIAEMPELNQLVKGYEDRKDIVFLAITADDKESLLKFFKTKKFDYRVVNNVKNITETFNTNALPVHMVIGKNGEVINRSIGARPDIRAFLKAVIDANL